MGREINLLMVTEDGIRHYTAIKSLSRLLSSKNSNTKCKQHFCMNCLQGQELSRNNKKRSHTQLDSRKQVIAFQDRVITINIKEAQHPLK